MTKPQPAPKDELERIVVSNIADFGWHCVNVIEDNGCPPWSFTIGLYETWEHPELIVIRRSRATSHAILKTLADDIELNDPPDLTNPDGHRLLGLSATSSKSTLVTIPTTSASRFGITGNADSLCIR